MVLRDSEISKLRIRLVTWSFDVTESTTLLMLVDLKHEAQQLTGVRVFVLTPGFLSPKFRNRVLQQAQPL